MRSILYDRKSLILKPLKDLVEEQNHRVLVLWTIDCATYFLPFFERDYPCDKRPYEAVEGAKLWSAGKIKMPEARRMALASHQAAKDVIKNKVGCAIAHAMGHVLGTVHVETHALGFVFYSLTAIHFAYPETERKNKVDETILWLQQRLIYWKKHEKEINQTWAPFLLRDEKFNKEKLLRIKNEEKSNKE